jgi:hypothetical protein
VRRISINKDVSSGTGASNEEELGAAPSFNNGDDDKLSAFFNKDVSSGTGTWQRGGVGSFL